MAARSFVEERRLFARFKFSEGCMVVSQNIVGIIDDIGLGGVSFKCVDREECCLDSSSDDIEIVLPFGHILVKAGHYRVVNADPRPDAASPPGLALIKKYHIHFLDLSTEESCNLWRLIKIHSIRSWETEPGKPATCYPLRRQPSPYYQQCDCL